MIEMAKLSMHATSDTVRDIQSLTFNLPRELVPKLKDKIQVWMKETMDLENDSSSLENEVYQLNIQLFPFTKKVSSK